ncbi:MAG: right-handed parallel beta-helix repeat-containing protein [Bacteroidota bacterium]|nr:right-handed parallel beta-helix repeat-containing protein [Bacteroidota bacterium]
MKKTPHLNALKGIKILMVAGIAVYSFSACTKNSTTVNVGPQLPAEAITGTVLNGGVVKGVLLSDSTYTMNGDITVLPTDTLTVQPGATINVTGNHAFYVQGIIQSLGTQAKPVTFTSTVAQQPGQWGGFQCDSAKAVTFKWTKILWTGGPDSTGSTRQTISVSTPIPVDVEDSWFIGGQDNSIGVYSTATATILRNTFYGNGTTDGDAIDFHSGVIGTVAYNVLWGGAGSAIKIYTSKTAPTVQTSATVYNNTCVDNGFRRGAGEPGRGILVDAYSKAIVYNNLLVNNYWSLDVTPSADYANTKYGNNYFYVTVDSLRAFMYPAGEKGVVQSTDIIDTVHTGANDPMFAGYTTPPNPSLRIIPSSFDFHLKSGSPAFGKGNPTYNNDIGAYTSDGQGNKH